MSAAPVARRLKGAKHIAGNPAPAVINLLRGALSLAARWPHELLAGIALARLRPHLVDAEDNTAGRRRRVELLDRPLFRAKSGSTRAPNQVSSWRHFRPSRMKISLIRLRRMAMPCSDRYATKRSSVHDAKGRPNSAGRVRAVRMTALRSSAE